MNEVRVSEPPVFDIDRAKIARSEAREFIPEGFSALRIAHSLGIYNAHSADELEQAQYRAMKLLDDEIRASNPANPLPTLGVEVESPRKPFTENLGGTYANFFDFIGMPRNKVNRGTYPRLGDFWEFSPPPSYTGGTQARIICELIKGGFVPSLVGSDEPEDIHEYLDSKLVSLHINLGLPSGMPKFETPPDSEFAVLSKSFSLAFTSGMRHLWRSQSSFAGVKNDANPNIKSGQHRLEMKPFEVRTAATYRLLEEIQMLAAAALAHINLDTDTGFLAKQWHNYESEVVELFHEHNLSNVNFTKKEFLKSLIENSNVSANLRHVITFYGGQIRGWIDRV